MGIHDELSADLRAAMKAKDRPRRDVIRQVETEVAVARSAPGFVDPIDDDLYRRVIGSYVKKMAKARDEYAALGDRGRTQADKLAYEIDYLSHWLPEKLSEEETRSLVRVTIVELDVSDPRQTGRVIGAVMKSGFDVDGSLVSRLVGEELGG